MLRVCLLGMMVSVSCGGVAESAEKVDYARDVVPFVRKYCLACHEGAEAEGGLRLDSHAAILKGTSKGSILQPGKSGASRLWLVISGQAQPAMPPKDSPVPSRDELDLIRRWIDEGASPGNGAPSPIATLNVPHIAPRKQVPSAITSLAWSPDGKRLALASYGTVRLIDAPTRGLLAKIDDLRGNITAVSFSQDGKRLLAAGGEPGLSGEAWMLDVSSLSASAPVKRVQTFVGHRDSLYAAALAPDGLTLATGSYDQSIILWDVATGTMRQTLTGHNGAIYDLAFHPHGRWLASASADRTVKLWNVADGARLDTLSQSTKEVNSLAFTPDGKRLLTGAADHRLRSYDISPTAAENSNPLRVTRYAHEAPLLKLALSSDGQTLATSSEDKTIKLWDGATLVERKQLDLRSDWVAAAAINDAQKQLALGGLDGRYELLDLQTGKSIPPPKLEVSRIEPRGIERGQSATLVVHGTGFADVVEARLVVGDKLIEPRGWEHVPGSRLETIWSIPADARPGPATLRLKTSSGEIREGTVQIDVLPQVIEQEPNDAAPQAQSITLNRAIWGVLDRQGDVDQFRFTAQKGTSIVVELTAKPLGSQLNGRLALVNPQGEMVASNNDFDGQIDPLLAYVIPNDGEYRIRVHDLTFGGSTDHVYRLAVGTFPLVTTTFPLSVPVGQETRVELVGFNLPGDAHVVVRPTQAGELPLPLDTARYRAPRTIKLLASSDREVVEREPNDLPRTATPLPTLSEGITVVASGRVGPPVEGRDDVDLYRFSARRGQRIVLETMAARLGSPVDTKLAVLDAQGAPVPRMLLQGTRDSQVTFRPVSSDTPDIRVTHWEEMELNEYMYLQGEVCRIFRLPQGPDSGFQFYTMNGKRRGYFDTSATTHALDEPCYIVEPQPLGATLVPNGLPVFTVHYENDDDAQRQWGTDSRLLFEAPADGEYLVRVSDSRGFGGDRFAYRLLLHEARPDFQVKLTTTNVNLSAGSGANLTFTAERIDGFDEDIRLDVSGVPTGFSIATPIVIQAGHQEARSVVNVGPTAPEKVDWSQLKIIASARIGDRDLRQNLAAGLTVKLQTAPKLRVVLEATEVAIVPGTTTPVRLRVERNGHTGRVSFNVPNLPHGVIVDNIGLNGILIPEGQDERTLFLHCAGWVPETDRFFFAEATNVPDSGNQSSQPVLLRVRRTPAVAAKSE